MGEIAGVSYIGMPKANTAMYVTAKVDYLVANLAEVSGCTVFAETGIDVPDAILSANNFIFCDNPLVKYIDCARSIEYRRNVEERQIPYRRTESGAYISETATIGCNAYIEPGVLIGPGVTIGSGATVLSGAVIKQSTIGDNVIINEYAVVGSAGFTMAYDDNGAQIRIPTLGRVTIGDNVEIGAHDNISCGSAGDTVIQDNAKIDALVHIGHDARIGRNVRITAGAIVGGYTELEDDAFLGINSVLRNRIVVGKASTIGMGAVVTKSVDNNTVVVGNPARPFVHE